MKDCLEYYKKSYGPYLSKIPDNLEQNFNL